MKWLMFWLGAGLLMGSCKSGERIPTAESGYFYVQPVTQQIQEQVRDTLVVEEELIVSPQEKAAPAENKEALQYCIIVGSFMYQQNALHLQRALMRQGFFNCSIMRSSEGMYRVSLLCDETLPEAQEDLCRIRSQFPRFREAWLLSVREKEGN